MDSTLDAVRNDAGSADSTGRLSARGKLAGSDVVDPTGCWCGSARWTLQFRTRRFGLVRCPACSTYRIDPRPLRQAEAGGMFYTDYYSTAYANSKPLSDPRTSRTSRFWRVAEQFPELLKVGRSVVDIGSGEGHLCAELHGRGWQDVIGLDISRTRVERARRHYPAIRFYDTPLQATDIPRGSLNLAVLDAVIEHLPEPVDVLAGIRDYLARSGRIVLITPNMDSGEYRYLGRRWTGMLAPHAHIFLFTPQTLAALLTKAGFEVEATGDFHSGGVSLASWRQALARADLRSLLWRVDQDLASAYARLLRKGPLAFAVARRP